MQRPPAEEERLRDKVRITRRQRHLNTTTTTNTTNTTNAITTVYTATAAAAAAAHQFGVGGGKQTRQLWAARERAVLVAEIRVHEAPVDLVSQFVRISYDLKHTEQVNNLSILYVFLCIHALCVASVFNVSVYLRRV